MLKLYIKWWIGFNYIMDRIVIFLGKYFPVSIYLDILKYIDKFVFSVLDIMIDIVPKFTYKITSKKFLLWGFKIKTKKDIRVLEEAIKLYLYVNEPGYIPAVGERIKFSFLPVKENEFLIILER